VLFAIVAVLIGSRF